MIYEVYQCSSTLMYKMTLKINFVGENCHILQSVRDITWISMLFQISIKVGRDGIMGYETQK